MDSHGKPLSDEMLLALSVWLCSLPLVALVIGPWLGWPAALTAAAVLLVAALLACWGACGWKTVVRRPGGNNKR